MALEQGVCDWCKEPCPDTKLFDDGERVCWPCIAEASQPDVGVYAMYKKAERGELILEGRWRLNYGNGSIWAGTSDRNDERP